MLDGECGHLLRGVLSCLGSFQPHHKGDEGVAQVPKGCCSLGDT